MEEMCDSPFLKSARDRGPISCARVTDTVQGFSPFGWSSHSSGVEMPSVETCPSEICVHMSWTS